MFALGIRPPRVSTIAQGMTLAEVDQPTFAPSALLPDTALNRRNTLAALAQSTGGQVRWLRTEADLGADAVREVFRHGPHDRGYGTWCTMGTWCSESR